MRIIRKQLTGSPTAVSALVAAILLLTALTTASAATAAQPRTWSWFGAYITGDAVVGGTLTCHPGVWTGAPTSYTYTWRRGSTVLGSGPQYTPGVADVLDYAGGQNNRVACRVTAVNDSGSYPSSDYVGVRSAPGAPAPRSIPVLRGLLAVGEELTCQPPHLRNAASSTMFAFASASGGQAASASNTYTVRDGDVGGTITCTARVENASGVATVRSESLPPTAAAGSGDWSLTPAVEASLVGTGVVGEMLTCDPGSWPAGTTISYSWRVGYAQVATSSTYTPTIADQGKRISCEVHGVNGASEGYSYVQLDAVIPGPGVESNSVAPSITGTPAPGYSLTCNPGTWSGPPSGYEYAWARDIDAPVTWGRSADAVLSLSGGNSIAYYGHDVRCAVRASNADGWSSWTYSDTVKIDAPAGTPSNSVRPSISGTPTNGSTLTCEPGSWTNAPHLAYQWLREDGSGFPGNRSSTLDLVRYPVGQKIRCHVGAVNGDHGFTAASQPVTIGSAPGAPTHQAAPTITGSGIVGEPLTCHVSSSDPGATQYVAWHLDGFMNAPGTLGYDVYHPTSAQVGRRITCGADLQNAFGYASGRSAEPGILIRTAASAPPADPAPPIGDPPPPVVVEPQHEPPAPTPGGDEERPVAPPVAPRAPKPSAITLVGPLKFRSISRGVVTARMPVSEAGVTVRISVAVTGHQARALGINAPRHARRVSIGSGIARSSKGGPVLVQIRLTPAARSAFVRASQRRSPVRSVRTTMVVSLAKAGLTSKVAKTVYWVR